MNYLAPHRLQLVWFTPEAAQFDAPEMFRQIFGEHPQTSQLNKQVSPVNPVFSAAVTEEKGERTEFISQPGRVDVAISRAPAPHEEMVFELTGNLHERLASLQKIQLAVSPAIPFVNRCGVTVILTASKPDLATASAAVNERLGNPIPFEDALDVTVQANRRRSFKFNSSVVMNRMMSFRALTAAQVGIAMGPEVSPAGFANNLAFAEACHIDLNNVPTAQMFSSTEVASMFSEMILEAQRLGELGSFSGLANG